MLQNGLVINVEPAEHSLFNASVFFGRDNAHHIGFPSRDEADRWARTVSKKMVKQSLIN